MDRDDRRSLSLKRGIAAAVFLAAIAAASLPPARADGCAAPTSTMQQVEMYFGTSVKGKPFVTADAWSEFLASGVTPKFPDGLTVFDAQGQRRSDDGRIYREATHVLLILYKADATTEGKIEAIRDAYKKQFQQEELPLRVDTAVCAAF
jgi:hypothetical protein